MAREERLERLEEVVVVGAEDVLRAHQRVLARLRVVVEPLDVREELVELLVREAQPLPEKVLAVEVRRRRLVAAAGRRARRRRAAARARARARAPRRRRRRARVVGERQPAAAAAARRRARRRQLGFDAPPKAARGSRSPSSLIDCRIDRLNESSRCSSRCAFFSSCESCDFSALSDAFSAARSRCRCSASRSWPSSSPARRSISVSWLCRSCEYSRSPRTSCSSTRAFSSKASSIMRIPTLSCSSGFCGAYEGVTEVIFACAQRPRRRAKEHNRCAAGCHVRSARAVTCPAVRSPVRPPAHVPARAAQPRF